MKKIKKYLIISIIFIVIIVFMILLLLNFLFAIVGYKQKETNKPIDDIHYNFIPAVESLRENCNLSIRYLKNNSEDARVRRMLWLDSNNDNTQWVNYCLALIQYLTNGIGDDVFALEATGDADKYVAKDILRVGKGIESGTLKFVTLMDKAGVSSVNDTPKIKIAIQAFILGEDYIASAKNSAYSVYNANTFIELHDLTGKDASFADKVTMLALGKNLQEIYFIYPLLNYKNTNSGFGYRIDPITGEKGALHGGMDFAAPRGTEIRAAADGVVTTVANNSILGNYIEISHNGRIKTLYGHSSKLIAVEGQEVKQGDVIALVGTTGKSTGNHVHLELYLDNQRIDPSPYLNIEEAT